MIVKYTKLFLLQVLFTFIGGGLLAAPGDTTVVHTFRFDTNMRQGVFVFPNEGGGTQYEKIIMLYSMRCKNGLVSTQTAPNQGCGEWDYNCYTYLVDSSQTDSLKSTHPSYLISNFSGDTFPYTAQPIYAYTQYIQQLVNYDTILSETTAAVGNGETNLTHPFNTGGYAGRTFYLWSAAELTAAGLNPGNISGLRLYVLSPGNTIANLRIGMKVTGQAVLDASNPETEGFTEVFFLDTPLAETGEHQFNFYTPFTWDGISNLLVDFSYTNPESGSTTEIAGQDAGSVMGLTDFQPDSYLTFKGSAQALRLNPAFFSEITDKITIAFWCYGDTLVLPANTTFLEGVDQNNQRQVNIHLPWSDSHIYWDCGNDGSGYDRIDKAAATDEIKGKWNFWTFTKDASAGTMKIYKNGHLWASGTGKTRPIDIKNWFVGRDASGSLNYYGHLDELSIWNKDLDSLSIAQIMYKDITPTHPDFSNLLACYHFNEGNGDTARDSGPGNFASRLINPGWRHHKPKDYFRNFAEETSRPNTIFVQGTYIQTTDSLPVFDSTLTVPTSVVSFTVHNNNLVTLDTLYVWPSGYTYITNPSGTIIDSVAVPAQGTLSVNQLTYYQFRPMRIELINFITPYGKGLNMNGLTGRTWTFDVTDYAPVLRGKKFLAMSDGVYQEDNDITFVFYEGTPPREAKYIQNIWPSGTWVVPSYNDIYNNNFFEPRMLKLKNMTFQYKIRTAISGHGQEGEFIPRLHTLTLNDTVNFTYKVWKHCGDNPIYPQGGTWVYERAGWCPGAVVDSREFEITPYVEPWGTIKLDYSLPNSINPGSSNYRVNNQLVSYSAPNFTLDAALDYIKQPSDRVEFSRLNPLCNKPLVAIKNTGLSNISSLDIIYGRLGGTLSTFHWTGSLEFLQSQEVTLPIPDWTSSSSDQFIAYVKNPNNAYDQYARNDTAYSKFLVPPAYPNKLMFELKTNSWAYENSWYLMNSNGDTLINRSSLYSDSLYRDTIDLPDDCYILHLLDTGDDGLTWWANSAQGSGYFRIKSRAGNTIYKNFNPDFGDNIYLQFYVDHTLSVNNIKPQAINNLELYPNPASQQLTVEITLIPCSLVTVSVVNITGQQVVSEILRTTQPTEKLVLDLSKLENGVYFVWVESGTNRLVRKVVVSK